MDTKFDRRRRYYMVLDCETATLPYAQKFDGKARQQVAIAKPLIYDLGWKIIDRQGRVYAKKNYLISEIFSVPSVFNTAYYASKRPKYIEMLNNGEITLTDWRTAVAELVADMEHCTAVGAYNSMFDFKKAIPFTELYINELYSDHYYEWEQYQNRCCDSIANGYKQSGKDFDPDVFLFRGKSYPLFDIWGLACEHLLNCDEYKRMCIDEGWQSASGKYFKTSAEAAYRFLKNDPTFDEAHTALDDVEIESEILVKILKPKASNMAIGITYFPFRILGTVENFNY